MANARAQTRFEDPEGFSVVEDVGAVAPLFRLRDGGCREIAGRSGPTDLY